MDLLPEYVLQLGMKHLQDVEVPPVSVKVCLRTSECDIGVMIRAIKSAVSGASSLASRWQFECTACPSFFWRRLLVCYERWLAVHDESCGQWPWLITCLQPQETEPLGRKFAVR